MSDYEIRFGGVARLYGIEGLKRLQQAHVCVVGLGGVGSWAAEALARSGVGKLFLVDQDEVCVSNINRQLPALTGTVGRPKTDVIAERVKAIAPKCRVLSIQEFFTAQTVETILASAYDYVVDAIDGVTNKALLIASCKARGLPVVTAGGAGGRRDPTTIRVADLAESNHDRLLQQVRRKLRDEHGFSRDPKVKFGVTCVFSPEPQMFPHDDGTVCAEREAGSDTKLDCNSGFGTAAFVTGAFGLAAASVAVSHLATGAAGS